MDAWLKKWMNAVIKNHGRIKAKAYIGRANWSSNSDGKSNNISDKNCSASSSNDTLRFRQNRGGVKTNTVSLAPGLSPTSSSVHESETCDENSKSIITPELQKEFKTQQNFIVATDNLIQTN